MKNKSVYFNEFYRDTLCHYGRKGMKWGENIFGDDDLLSNEGRSRLRGYDDDDFNIGWGDTDRYVTRWEREYGYTPINRLRFDSEYEKGGEYVNSGREWLQGSGYHDASWSKIYDAYSDYKSSRKWD